MPLTSAIVRQKWADFCEFQARKRYIVRECLKISKKINKYMALIDGQI